MRSNARRKGYAGLAWQLVHDTRGFAMRFPTAVAFASALVLVPFLALASTWHVPSEAPTIQAGIDSAAVGTASALADRGRAG